MKKSLLFFTALVLVGYCFTQEITITDANQIPVLGQSVKYQRVSSSGFDPAGEGTTMDMTWDLAELTDEGDEISLTYVEVSQTPDGGMFPNATLAEVNLEEDVYFYYEFIDGDWLRWGSTEPSEDMWSVYSSSTIEFSFPITTGNTFSSSYYGNFSPFNVGEDSVKIEDGSINIHADAQGTLILPTGTYENVVRVRVDETYELVVYMMNTVIMTNTFTDEVYYWFHEDHFKPILMYATKHLDGDLIAEVLQYQVMDAEESIELTSADNTDDQIVCLGDDIITITYSTTGVTDANISGLPDGVTGTYLENIITIQGSPTEAGVFNYIIELIGGEEDLTAEGTITINDLPLLTCPNDFVVTSDSPVDLDDLTVSPGGGVFSGDYVSDGAFHPEGLNNGEYTIIYTYTDPDTGCENYCTFIITVDYEVSITVNNTEELSVYPNPAINEIIINNSEGYDYIKFYDLTGREIMSQLLNKPVVDISALPSGMYIIELIGNNTRDITKIIVK